MADFAGSLLKALGAKQTPENLRFVNAWVQAEGTKAAYNPLATTQGAPGATSFNSVNVRNYPDYQTGLKATVQTLLNGYYDPIVSGLRSGSSTAAQLGQAVANSPWGTGGGVLRVLGQPGSSSPSTPSSAPGALPQALPSALPMSKVPGLIQPGYPDLLKTIVGKSGNALTNALTNASFRSSDAALMKLPSFELPGMPTASPTGEPVTPMPGTAPVDVGKWVKLASGADRSGSSTNASVFNAVAKIANQFGQPLTITTGTNHNQFVLGTDRESQHWQGNAADIMFGNGSPGHPDPALTKLGRAALVTAGMSPAEAAKQTGGAFHVNGWNIIFNSMTGGNHYNHLHVGV